MTWVDIPNNELAVDAPVRSINALQIRDNIAHVRDGLGSIQYFTTSGTYNKGTDIRRVRVTVIGGGGAFNAGQNTGGGGGGTAVKNIDESAVNATEAVTVGTAGNDSSFGAHCSATAGADGGVTNGDGGSGTDGDLNIDGVHGFQGGQAGSGLIPGIGCGGGSSEGARAGIVIVEEFY